MGKGLETRLVWDHSYRVYAQVLVVWVVSVVSRGQITLAHAYSQLDSRATQEWFASDTRVPFNLLMVGTVGAQLEMENTGLSLLRHYLLHKEQGM